MKDKETLRREFEDLHVTKGLVENGFLIEPEILAFVDFFYSHISKLEEENKLLTSSLIQVSDDRDAAKAEITRLKELVQAGEERERELSDSRDAWMDQYNDLKKKYGV